MAQGMAFSISNLFGFFSTIAPILLGFFMLMISIFNQNVKGLIYIAGVLLALIINLLFMNLIASPTSADAAPTCKLIDFPFGLSQYNNPAPNSMFIAFTFAYLFLPMKMNNYMNYPVIGSILGLFGLDAVAAINGSCTTIGGVLIGGLVGMLLGAGWYGVFHATGNDSLLFYDEFVSNGVVCEKPSKQTFKCAVYKNGEIVKNL